MIDLLPFTEDDIDRLLGWVTSEAEHFLWTASALSFPPAREAFQKLMRDSAERGDRLFFKAVERDSGNVIGHLELGAIDLRNRSTRIGRVLLAPEARGRGLGEAIMRAGLAKGFDEMGMHRVDLWVFASNARAIACYERAGFRHDGVIREAFKAGEEYWSFLVMSVLEREWAAMVG
jgi:RimJ/RimL family protein N-acetyltransferase